MYSSLVHRNELSAWVKPPGTQRAASLDLERFLAGVERRALVLAELATRDRDEGLDLVQDAMLAFVKHYAGRPAEQWPPLFHRVLQNRIRDWHRRGKIRQRLFGWLGQPPPGSPQAQADPVAHCADPNGRSPEVLSAQAMAADAMLAGISALPLRQQQAFLLRIWEGLDVAATAQSMGCSQGSVKTHLARALATLRTRLEDHR